MSKLSEDQEGLHQKCNNFFPRIQVKTKKKVFTKKGTLFFPNSSGDLRSDAHQSQIIGGYADVKLLGGYSQSIGGDLSPPGFGTPGIMWLNSVQYTRIKGGRRSKTCYKTAISTELQQIKNYAKPVAIGQLSCWNTHIRPSLNQFLVFILYTY